MSGLIFHGIDNRPRFQPINDSPVIVIDAGASQMPEEIIKQQCITEEDAKNPEAAFRRDFTAAGFTVAEFKQDGNTMNATATHVSEVQNIITSTKHSEVHTSSTTNVISSSASSTSTQESRWIAEDC
ncbi:MAG: DUF3617 family protein [Halomonas sp.]|nr:DUF3617 family protein [Halomonas sp.]TVP52405.1 MAG: DUF3617 family protein [Halomonas sp.]